MKNIYSLTFYIDDDGTTKITDKNNHQTYGEMKENEIVTLEKSPHTEIMEFINKLRDHKDKII